jgi:tRNA(Ile)-lysidine synthase
LARVRDDLSGITQAHIEAVRQLAASDRAHGELSLPNLHVRMERNRITLTLERPAIVSPWAIRANIGETTIPPAGLALRLERAERDGHDVPSSDAWTELADADRIAYPLEVRARREGDRFAPLGLGAETKLKDFLINERVPFYERDRLALLCDQERILWVIGVRLSDDVRITDSTKHVLVMHAEALS